MQVGLIIFDLDGTLVDSAKDIAWSANMTLEAMGYAKKDAGHIKDNIGWGVKNLLEKLMPGEGPEVIERARKRFLEFYATHLAVDTMTYPGVDETLEHFSGLGKRMAVVTNKPIELSNGILAELGLSKYFEMVVGGDSFVNRKPHPEPVEAVLNALAVGPKEAVMVGDSPIDDETGKSAGLLATIGVTYGFRDKGELRNFDYLIDGFGELKGLIS